ncbi:hypothetical protein [Algoriphagus marinus]|jgi:hypothetical protein|uniref:hypothetical protein n=1 Tax=Algoriphagus marinus TaxID=1925762 RepID=UPI00094B86AA|nr:hypothetical protein [Algoriphagus marinus]
MTDSSIFPFKKITFFGIAVLGFCFLPEVSFAQEDLGKVESEILKPSDRVNQDNNINLLEGSPAGAILNPKQTVVIQKGATVKKENPLVGEGKKTEPAPSTLNFNIFLYIVDKFKAD